ncbi:putative phage repressor [Burkholderiales bacterium GJ-E10]|nr:putative phage repressor [Burkholderiales bacterium GJ-E10]
MKIGERVKAAREARGITRKALADGIGMPYSTLADLENGYSEKSEWLPQIANFLSLNAYELVTGQRSVSAAAIVSDHTAEYSRYIVNVQAANVPRPSREVPSVGKVKGGQNGYFEEYQYPTGHGEGVIDYPTTDSNAYALRVVGDSMAPRYRAGEFIIVEPNIEAQPGTDVVVIGKDGQRMLKVLAWRTDTSISLLSINNGHPPMTLDLTEIDQIHAVAGSVPSRALRPFKKGEST